MQKEGIDYDELFSNTLHMDTFRILLSLAAYYDWDIISLDVVGAFLNGRLEEEIYMNQIPGYEDNTNEVLQIKGSLYSLKQAPRIWNKTFIRKAKEHGFQQSLADPSLYV